MNRHLSHALCALATGAAVSANAQETTATLRISVVKQVLGESAARPFQGVGVFDLVRGGIRLDGAKCPDKSGPTGQLTCTIPCKRDAKDAMVVRVKPPSDQDVLAGWVTPASQDVQVERCALKPTTVTMLYEDARVALNDLLSKQYFANVGGGGNQPDKSWIAEITRNPGVAGQIAKTSGTATGKAELMDLHRYATEAASSPYLQSKDLSPEQKDLAIALAKWQLLSKSALLESQISKAVPPDQRDQLRLTPTTDLATYRANLTLADQILTKVPKSSSQLRLVDDIKTLKAMPSTGKDAAAAAKIIDKWN